MKKKFETIPLPGVLVARSNSLYAVAARVVYLFDNGRAAELPQHMNWIRRIKNAYAEIEDQIPDNGNNGACMNCGEDLEDPNAECCSGDCETELQKEKDSRDPNKTADDSLPYFD
jgi:hypothetical protein